MVLLIMLFLHIVDDYYLQGFLASAKQKTWWEKNYPDKKYRYDYIIALCMHAFSWTFMIMLPYMVISWFNNEKIIIWLYVVNFIIHAIIDDLKANKLKINLIQDQLLHIVQIILTWIIVMGR